MFVPELVREVEAGLARGDIPFMVVITTGWFNHKKHDIL
jgi:hypothetical protein